MLDPIDTPFDNFIADGAYDGDPDSKAVLSLQPDAQVIVLPHKTAVCSTAGGPYRWAKKTGYSLRNYAELAMQRYKGVFGNTMKARKLPQQKAAAWASGVAPDRMAGLGMPVSVKI